MVEVTPQPIMTLTVIVSGQVTTGNKQKNDYGSCPKGLSDHAFIKDILHNKFIVLLL